MHETLAPRRNPNDVMAAAEAARASVAATGGGDDENWRITQLEKELEAGADPDQISKKVDEIDESREQYH